jgi:hypothetical protein
MIIEILVASGQPHEPPYPPKSRCRLKSRLLKTDAAAYPTEVTHDRPVSEKIEPTFGSAMKLGLVQGLPCECKRWSASSAAFLGDPEPASAAACCYKSLVFLVRNDAGPAVLVQCRAGPCSGYRRRNCSLNRRLPRLEHCTDSEIAAELNKKGWRSSANQPFSEWIIYQLRTSHKLPSRTERLRAKGLLNAREIACNRLGADGGLSSQNRAEGLCAFAWDR